MLVCLCLLAWDFYLYFLRPIFKSDSSTSFIPNLSSSSFSTRSEPSDSCYSFSIFSFFFFLDYFNSIENPLGAYVGIFILLKFPPNNLSRVGPYFPFFWKLIAEVAKLICGTKDLFTIEGRPFTLNSKFPYWGTF